MNIAIKRSILRWIHLIFTIPILGYIYGEASEVQQYAPAVRNVFVPVIMFAGYWMYSGAFFAISGGYGMAWCILPLWNWGSYSGSGRAIHRAQDLVDDSCATFKVIRASPLGTKGTLTDAKKYEEHHQE